MEDLTLTEDRDPELHLCSFHEQASIGGHPVHFGQPVTVAFGPA